MDHSMRVEQTLLKLLQYTALNEDTSYITTEQLQEFLVHEFIPLIDPFNEMDESFYDFYCCQVIQKFSYYLDLQNNNRINIRKLIHSSIMEEMFQLVRLQKLLQEKQQSEDDDEHDHNQDSHSTPRNNRSNSSSSGHHHRNLQKEQEINELIDKVCHIADISFFLF
jgi:hypothetical protein